MDVNGLFKSCTKCSISSEVLARRFLIFNSFSSFSINFWWFNVFITVSWSLRNLKIINALIKKMIKNDIPEKDSALSAPSNSENIFKSTDTSPPPNPYVDKSGITSNHCNEIRSKITNIDFFIMLMWLKSFIVNNNMDIIIMIEGIPKSYLKW